MHPKAACGRRSLKGLRPPISPPSAVTAALFDMFCGLKGATFSPDWQSAAKPGDQHGFAYIRAGAHEHDGSNWHQNSMPFCAFTPAPKWCFTMPISVTRSAASISAAGVASGDDDMKHRPAGLKTGDHLVQRQIVIAKRDVEFIEHNQTEARIGHHHLRHLPAGAGGGDIAG